MLANPPFGVEWKKVADPIKKEHAKQGYGGRFVSTRKSCDGVVGVPRTGGL
jgi:type I restriction enzyme M protein